MIGQAYLDVRTRLENALKELSALTQESRLEDFQVAVLDNLRNSLKDPFVFVVAGEVNVGKSTLLNGLFGADFSRTGILPTTDKIYFFRHGAERRHVPVSATLEEVYVPAEFLKDFHVVDTPGTNSVESHHQEITERFVPTSDMVIFVFSAMNPWAASAWQFLEKVHRQWMRHVVFVLQQCDLRAQEEIDAILTYMKQLCRQRFDREFPIFPVSAKNAFLARSSGLDRERLIQSSGFENLEKHISKAIGSNGARLGKLGMAVTMAEEILQTLGTTNETQYQTHGDRMEALNVIESGLSQQEERIVTKLLPSVDAAESDFQHAVDQWLSELKLTLTPDSAPKAKAANELQEKLTKVVSQPNEARWAQCAVIIEDDINNTGSHLSDAMQEKLHVQVRDDIKPKPEFWTERRKKFLSDIQDDVQKHAATLKVADILRPALAKAQQRSVWMWLLLLGGLGAGGYFLWLKQFAVGSAIIGVGIVLSMLLRISSRRLLRSAITACGTRLTDAKPGLGERLKKVLREEVKSLTGGFTSILQPARENLLKHQQAKQTFEGKLNGLNKTFKTLGTDIKDLATQR